MNLQNTPIYYIKHRIEKGEDKALRELKNEEGVEEITAIEEGILKTRRRVTMKHCFKNEKIHETIRRRKHQGGFFVPLKREEETI